MTFVKKKIRTRAQFQNIIVSFGFIFICVLLIMGIVVGIVFIFIQLYKIHDKKLRQKKNYAKNDDEAVDEKEYDTGSNNSDNLSLGKTSNVDTEFEREIKNEQEYDIIKNRIV